MNSKTALIIGATGATGSALVSQLIKDDAYAEIHVFVRNKPNLEHPKLKVHVVDFNKIEDLHIIEDIVKVSEEHELETYPAALLYHSKNNI